MKSKSKPGIKASSIPQWLWTRNDCRAWVYDVLYHYLYVSKFITLDIMLHLAISVLFPVIKLLG
jgi:hypothetical protein